MYTIKFNWLHMWFFINAIFYILLLKGTEKNMTVIINPILKDGRMTSKI